MGVMDGHASDLRTGLPWQMVEIHEPVRILFVVETTPDRLERVIETNNALKQLPVALSSHEWYAGKLQHLPMAWIQTPRTATGEHLR